MTVSVIVCPFFFTDINPEPNWALLLSSLVASKGVYSNFTTPFYSIPGVNQENGIGTTPE